MKYCYECGHTTGGQPLFCIFCGCSYNVKLCPKLHPNPRFAEACSRCGSRDLSTPQPKIPLSWKILAILIQALSGALLMPLSFPVLIELLAQMHNGSRISVRLLAFALLLSLSWSLWATLPTYMRQFIHQSLNRRT
jgi:hypothetical protein